MQGAAEGQRIAQRSLVDPPAVLAGEPDRSADGVGEAPQIAPVVHLAVQTGQCRRPEEGREPAAVEALQGAAVRQQGDPAAGDQVQLPDGGGRQHTALGVPGDHQPAVEPLGPGGHPPGEVGDGTLGVTGRREGVGGAGPEGADVPEDADGAARGVVAVGAPAHGDQQYDAGAHQPGAEGLRRLGGGVHDGRRALGGTPGRQVGEPGTGHRAGPQNEGDRRDGRDQDGGGVGESGPRDGAGDALDAAPGEVLARVVEPGDVPGHPATDEHHPDGGEHRDGGDHHQEDGQDRGLPGQQDRRPGDRGVLLAGRRVAVHPVREALGHSPGQHPADRAGQQGDGRSAHAAQGGAGVVTGGALQDPGGQRQREDQQALEDGDTAEGGGTGQRTVAAGPGARPAGVHGDQHQRGEGGERQHPHHQAVGLVVRRGLTAGGAPHDHQGGGGEQRDQDGQRAAGGRQGGAAAGPRVGLRAGGEQHRPDGQHPGRGVGGTQPGDHPAAVPEAFEAERGAFGRRDVTGRAGPPRWRRGGFVGAPRTAREPPQEADHAQRHRGGEGQAAARGAPPAGVLGAEEAHPGLAGGAGGGAGALPGREVEGDLAGRGGEQHGEGEGEEAHQHVVEALGAVLGWCGRAHPVGEVGDHEGQQDQPQGAGAVAGGEVGPAVRLADRLAPVVVGPLLGVRVVRAAVAGRGVVAGDQLDAGIAEHVLGRGAADPVHQQLQGELGCRRRWPVWRGVMVLCAGVRCRFRSLHSLPRRQHGAVRCGASRIVPFPREHIQSPHRGCAGNLPPASHRQPAALSVPRARMRASVIAGGSLCADPGACAGAEGTGRGE